VAHNNLVGGQDELVFDGNSVVMDEKGQLIAGLVLLTLGSLFILDRLIILEVYISWPLIMVAVGIALFLLNPHSLASWIVGGIGVIFFVVTSLSPSFLKWRRGATWSGPPSW
jgi:hypothetical protein